MSDKDLIQSLDDLELLLQGGLVNAETLASWHERFQAALASADRGPEWAAIVTRAHELAARIDTTASALSDQQSLIGKEMNLHRRGNRALKGYKPA